MPKDLIAGLPAVGLVVGVLAEAGADAITGGEYLALSLRDQVNSIQGRL